MGERVWRAIICLALVQEAAFSAVEGVTVESTGSYVECKSQQEACVCDENQAERLKVEEVQTFTSYAYRRSGTGDRKLLVRGFAGSTYYLNETGIRPLLPGRTGSYSPCWSDNITRLADFLNELNCSIPMMVDGQDIPPDDCH